MKFKPRKNPNKPNTNIKNLLKGFQAMKQYQLATTNKVKN